MKNHFTDSFISPSTPSSYDGFEKRKITFPLDQGITNSVVSRRPRYWKSRGFLYRNWIKKLAQTVFFLLPQPHALPESSYIHKSTVGRFHESSNKSINPTSMPSEIRYNAKKIKSIL